MIMAGWQNSSKLEHLIEQVGVCYLVLRALRGVSVDTLQGHDHGRLATFLQTRTSHRTGGRVLLSVACVKGRVYGYATRDEGSNG